MKPILLLFIFSSFFLSCKNNPPDDYIITECPQDIAARAFRFAELYKDSDTEYLLGGQSPVRTAITIDCSGLIVMCYKYAIVDTKYSLLFNDASANAMYENYSVHTTLPQLRQGDLIFMGETNSAFVTHIAIFDKIENGQIYFIDSTEKDTNGDGVPDINGVTRHSYLQSDKRFKAFGIMKVRF